MTAARDWTEELSAYIDGELNDADRLALEQVLAKDETLRALEQRLRRTVETMKAMPAPEPSVALRRAVLNKLDEQTFGEKLRAFFSPGRMVSAGALVAAGIATVVVVSNREVRGAPGVENEEQLFLAQNMEVLEDMDLVGLEQPDDLEVVSRLDELKEAKP